MVYPGAATRGGRRWFIAAVNVVEKRRSRRGNLPKPPTEGDLITFLSFPSIHDY